MTFFSRNIIPGLRNVDTRILETSRQGLKHFWSQHPKPFLLSASKASSSKILYMLIISLIILSENPAQAQVKGIWDDQYTHAKSGIWDDNFTHAKSGVEGDLLDPGNSDGTSGVKPPAAKFFIPPERFYEAVDPEEIGENYKKHYTPYAVAQFTQSFTYRGQTINKGYYQVKLGGPTDGSPKNNLQAIANKPLVPSNQFKASGLPQEAVMPENEADDQAIDISSVRRVLILKQLGNVVAVLPVDRREVVVRGKGEKKVKRPLARVVLGNTRPALQYRIQDTLYTTFLEP